VVILADTHPPIHPVLSIGSAAEAYVNTFLHLPIYYFMEWKGAKLPFNHLPTSNVYIKLSIGKLSAVNIYDKFLRKKETHTKERKKLLCVGYYAIEYINSQCVQLSSVIVCIYAKM
jgi:hypothetical protein